MDNLYCLKLSLSHKKIIDRFKLERSKFLGSDDLNEVVRATFENRIDTLLVEADKILPGKINKDTIN